MKRTRVLASVVVGVVLLLGVAPQDTSAGEPAKPEFTLKLMGINRTLDPWKLFEEWAHPDHRG